MLVRTNATSRRPVGGHLAALAGEQVFCSNFQYRRGTEVFGEGEDAEYVYQIISGAVRTYKLLSDGRRQMLAEGMPRYKRTPEAQKQLKAQMVLLGWCPVRARLVTRGFAARVRAYARMPRQAWSGK